MAHGDGGVEYVQRLFGRTLKRLSLARMEKGRQFIEADFTDGLSVEVSGIGVAGAWQALRQLAADAPNA